MQKLDHPSYLFPLSHVFLISIVLFMLIFLVSCPMKTEEEMSIHIIGTVTDKTSGSPITDVIVDLYSEGFGTKKSSITDQEGQYSITYYGVYYDGFRIRAYKMGYYTWKEPIECTSETQTINIQLTPI